MQCVWSDSYGMGAIILTVPYEFQYEKKQNLHYILNLHLYLFMYLL